METILIYTPAANEPIKAVINDTYKDISNICRGFEIVKVKKLNRVLPNLVFITSDLYNDKDLINNVGTYLYDYDDVHIRGNICICKEVVKDGEKTLSGLTNEEIVLISERIASLIGVSYAQS